MTFFFKLTIHYEIILKLKLNQKHFRKVLQQ